jgi:hypothetical protein
MQNQDVEKLGDISSLKHRGNLISMAEKNLIAVVGGRKVENALLKEAEEVGMLLARKGVTFVRRVGRDNGGCIKRYER